MIKRGDTKNLTLPSYPMEWLKKYLNLYILSKGGKYVYAQYHYEREIRK